MTSRYEPPDERELLTKEGIHRRYQDTSLLIFKEQQSKKETNYLSYGTSRRTMKYSSYGNEPVIVRRPGESRIAQSDLSARISRIYQKPRDGCTIG